MTIIFKSVVTCPKCGHKKQETMQDDLKQILYFCEGCKTYIKPKEGDCCIFCSYGSVKCPIEQKNAQADEPPPEG